MSSVVEAVTVGILTAVFVFVACWILSGRRFFNEACLSGVNRRLWLVDRGRCPRVQQRKLACNLSAGQTSFRPYGRVFAREVRRGDTISFCLEILNTSGAPVPADEVWARDFIPSHLTYIPGTGIIRIGANNPVEVRVPDERFNQAFEVRLEESGLLELQARTSFTVRYRCRYGRIDVQTQRGGNLPPADWPAQPTSTPAPAPEPIPTPVAPAEREPESEAAPPAVAAPVEEPEPAAVGEEVIDLGAMRGVGPAPAPAGAEAGDDDDPPPHVELLET